MSFDWKEYLEIARFHHSAGGSATFSQEAALRCAVSRAYYAAFCCARNYARDRQGFVPYEDREDHRRVREHFRRRKPDIATRLSRLQEWREQCDYDDRVDNLATMAANAIDRARQIIDSLR